MKFLILILSMVSLNSFADTFIQHDVTKLKSSYVLSRDFEVTKEGLATITKEISILCEKSGEKAIDGGCNLSMGLGSAAIVDTNFTLYRHVIGSDGVYVNDGFVCMIDTSKLPAATHETLYGSIHVVCK